MPRGPALVGLATAQGIELYRRTDECAERIGRQCVALVDINGTACVAVQAGIEQARRVGQRSAAPFRKVSFTAVFRSLLTAPQGSRCGLCGMVCKARCAANSSAIGKRRNAADRPARHLPEGME